MTAADKRGTGERGAARSPEASPAASVHEPFISREDAAEEICRILIGREAGYPQAVADGKLSQAEANLYMDRLRAAWLYVLQPNLHLTSAASYRNTWKLAEELLREVQTVKGTRR